MASWKVFDWQKPTFGISAAFQGTTSVSISPGARFITKLVAFTAIPILLIYLAFFRVSEFTMIRSETTIMVTDHQTPQAVMTVSDKPLILYAYKESEHGRQNIRFFIAHGLHAAADFIFIFNGETDAFEMVPNATNIKIIRRDNSCYDIGAYAEVLKRDNLWRRYQRFILLNASIRGPFLPPWSDSCWSDRYLSKISETVKLVGMTLNCWPTPHVQSMIWATDSIGIDLLLHPPPNIPGRAKWYTTLQDALSQGSKWTDIPETDTPTGIDSCFTYHRAIGAEVEASSIIMSSGFEVDVMMTRFQADPNFVNDCNRDWNGDALHDHGYDGINLHPYEMLFMKTNRNIAPNTLNLLTNWIDRTEYTSYDVC